jgi:hypothetical protein
MLKRFWLDLMKAPKAALVFGLGGLLPFLALTVLALMARKLGDRDCLVVLVQYTAVILSFVGALHWGYALKEDAQGGQAWLRYGWSVVPALIAFAALQLPILIGLRVEALTIVLALLVDRLLDQRMSVSAWMRSLRLLLTTVVASLLLIASFA